MRLSEPARGREGQPERGRAGSETGGSHSSSPDAGAAVGRVGRRGLLSHGARQATAHSPSSVFTRGRRHSLRNPGRFPHRALMGVSTRSLLALRGAESTLTFRRPGTWCPVKVSRRGWRSVSSHSFMFVAHEGNIIEVGCQTIDRSRSRPVPRDRRCREVPAQRRGGSALACGSSPARRGSTTAWT
jgi:hypothetical protein